VFAAGTGTSPDSRNDIHPYYAGIGGKTPPAAQTALFPGTQTGATSTGSAGFAWRHMVVEKYGNSVAWLMDGKPMATVDITGMNGLGGGDILLNYYDINATTTNAAGVPLLFGLFDNVVVTPEPATVGFLVLAAPCFWFRRRKA